MCNELLVLVLIVLFVACQPTSSQRGWLVNPLDIRWFWIFAALLPALLATILIFMDQQITAVIVNRKENKLVVSLSCCFCCC